MPSYFYRTLRSSNSFCSGNKEPYHFQTTTMLNQPFQPDRFIVFQATISSSCSNVWKMKTIKVYWGDISLVKVEYLLFESALSHGPYAYYHLLSGTDLPIKSQDYIHAFFPAECR